MSPRKELVLDANILLRAVFGARVRQLLETYEDIAGFYSPDVCFGEAHEYIPDVAKRRAVVADRADLTLSSKEFASCRALRIAPSRCLRRSIAPIPLQPSSRSLPL